MDLTNTTLKQQYFLRRLVGRGGMADVYLAWDNLRAVDVAIKVLRRDLAQNNRFRRAFEREAESLANLTHPNIVRLFEFQSQNDLVYIVMAWVDGGSLRQRIDDFRRPFSPVEVGRILQPVCSALNYAHKMRIFHCDIKPANIMLHRNGADVFLADFGVARIASEQGVGGTPPYMAPEQFSAHVSAQADIYSLGVTVYEMLSGGNLPYHADSRSPGGTTRAKYAWEHNNLDLPPLSQFNPGLPGDLIAVVNCALQKDPRSRYRTAMAFCKDFSSIPVAPGTTRLPEKPTVVDRPPQPRQEPAPEPGVSRPPALGVPHVYARSGDLAGTSFPIPKQGLRIGRNADCEVHLREPSTSRHHATVFILKNGPFVRDDGSALGTLVNGTAIPSHGSVVLHDGDVIQTGYNQVLEFRLR